jgi:hypothetical protein
MPMTATKDDIAQKLADARYVLDEGIESIYRIARPGREEDPEEPVKLLEVNRVTIPAGIMPLYFRPVNEIIYPSVIVDVTPEEFMQIRSGVLPLPNGWTVKEKLNRGASDN